MSHTRVKTTYEAEGNYGSTEVHELYCHHNHSSDTTVYYDSDGSVASMVFGEWVNENDKWDEGLKDGSTHWATLKKEEL